MTKECENKRNERSNVLVFENSLSVYMKECSGLSCIENSINLHEYSSM